MNKKVKRALVINLEIKFGSEFQQKLGVGLIQTMIHVMQITLEGRHKGNRVEVTYQD